MPQFNSLVSEQPPQHAIRELPQKVSRSELGGPTIRYLPKRICKEEIHDAFGPDPDWALQCFVDLGLSDADIARCVGLSLGRIQILTRQIRMLNSTKHLV